MKKKKLVMNQQYAEEIRDLRYKKQSCSWRAVAGDFAEMHPELSICAGNQLEGMDLCNKAMEFLGETIEDGWNV